MDTSRLQISLASLLALVACVAVNIWLFRLGPLWGIIGVNVTKHVLIAVLCKALGLDRQSEVTTKPGSAGGSSPAATVADQPQAAGWGRLEIRARPFDRLLSIRVGAERRAGYHTRHSGAVHTDPTLPPRPEAEPVTRHHVDQTTRFPD